VSWRRGEEDYICTKRQNVIKKWKTLLKKLLKTLNLKNTCFLRGASERLGNVWEHLGTLRLS
jgi:hypothetical protein